MSFDPRQPPVEFLQWAESIALRSPEDRIRFGRAAERLLLDPVTVQLLAIMEANIFRSWSDCPSEDKDRQFDLKTQLNAVRAFRKMLDSYIAEGKMEEQNSESS